MKSLRSGISIVAVVALLAVSPAARAKFAVIACNPLLYRVRGEIGVDARAGVVGQYVILFRIVG